MKKKAQYTTPVNMIILVIALVLLIIIMLKLFVFTSATSSREICALASTPNSAQLAFGKSFWPTYEINCQAQRKVISASDLNVRSVTSTMLKAGGFEGVSSGDVLSPSEKQTLQLKDEFSQQLSNCWKAGGNRPLFNINAMEISEFGKFFELKTKGDPQRLARKAGLLQQKLGINIPATPPELVGGAIQAKTGSGQVDSSKEPQTPLVACMLCSQTELGPDLQLMRDGSNNIPLKSYLEKIKYSNGNDVSVYTVLTAKKGEFPVQEIGTMSSQAVVYYQYFEKPDQAQDYSRTGTVILNTQDVAKFCDVIANRG